VDHLIRVDDILAALIVSLVMMRRLEVKTTLAEHNPTVPKDRFDEWRAKALRAYSWVAGASAAKIAAGVGWYFGGMQLGVPAPWFQLVGLLVFMSWLLSLVWAWRMATDAAVMRRRLGIALRPRAARPPEEAPRRGPGPSPSN
jgi:hypothetical protein